MKLHRIPVLLIPTALAINACASDGGAEVATEDSPFSVLGSDDELAEPAAEEAAEFGSVQLAARSTDYPGPCRGETSLPASPPSGASSPQYLAVDYKGRRLQQTIFNFTQSGRLRLGISCVQTVFRVDRLGDNPGTVFRHECRKHGFGWYDVANLAPGAYQVTAQASAIEGLPAPLEWKGHGTADTYAFQGNDGNYQPVNCSPF